MVQRRRLGASWRRLRAAAPRGCGRRRPVSQVRSSTTARTHAAVGRANRARDHRGGARAASTSLATLCTSSCPRRTSTARCSRAARPADPDRGHLRRRPRKPSRGGGALLRRLACPATFFLTGAGLDGAHGFWWQRLQAARRTAASTHARRFARPPCAPAPSSRSPASPRRSSRRPRRSAPTRRTLAAHRRGPARVPPDAGAGAGAGAGRLRDRLPHPRSPTTARAHRRRARARPGRRTGRARGGHRTRLRVLAYPHGSADERVAAAAAAPATPTASAGLTGRSRREPIGCCSAGPSCCSRIPARSSWPWPPSYGRIARREMFLDQIEDPAVDPLIELVREQAVGVTQAVEVVDTTTSGPAPVAVQRM